MKITSLTKEYNINELKEEIRAVVEKHASAEHIHVSIVYYEINSYKKPLKKE